MAAGPNALRGSGPNRSHAFEGALTPAGSPDPRNDRVCITSLCPRQFLVTSACRQLRRRQQLRLLEVLAAHHHGPGHACDFVSKCNGGDLDRPKVHQLREARPLRAVLIRISDDSHGTGDEQPAQMPRLNRAVPRMRSAYSSSIILCISAVSLRRLAEIMPSSAICARIAFDSIVR